MHEVLDQLRRLQKTSRWMLIAQRGAVIVAIALGVVVVVALIDFALRMPREVRILLWITGLLAMAWSIATYLRAAIAFHPTLTTLALRIERALPRVSGRLASSVEFAAAHADEGSALARRTMTETEARLAGETMRRFIRASRTASALGLLAATIALCAVFIITTPRSARIGAERVLAPWTKIAWPARTAVRSLMHDVITPTGVYERGKGLVLRAAVTRGALDQRVDAWVRYQVDDEYQRWQRLVLTHQSDGIHERLIDTNASAVEIYFETADAGTDTLRVELAPAPAVERATLTVTPPDYALPVVPVLTEELGQGADDRAATTFASLMGSEAVLTLAMNKPLPVPGGDKPSFEWIKRTFGWEGETYPTFEIDAGNRNVWRLRWRVDRPANLNLDLIDQYGLTNGEPINFRINARTDRVPGVTITEPAADQVVLATATVPLTSEADDDVALEELGLEARVQKAVETRSASLPEQPALEPEIVWTENEKLSEQSAKLSRALDLSELELSEGDVVLVTAIARDSYELEGVKHEPARSAVRRLQVISELDYAEQIRRQLGGIRQNAIRVESLQAELQDDVEQEGVKPGVSRAQAQIGQRIAEQRQLISRLAEDIERNRLDDEQLQKLLEQSADLLDYAGRASSSASQMIEQRGEPDDQRGESTQRDEQQSPQTPGQSSSRANRAGEQRGEAQQNRNQSPRETAAGDRAAENENQAGQNKDAAEADDRQNDRAAGDEEEREITDAQQQVRDELSDLIELLDRDEDTWVITRQLETLLQEQQQLAEETGALGEQTVGRPASELTQSERSEMDRIVEKQTELSETARKLIEESRNRAKAMEEIDPQSAEGMRKAAETAEQRELDQDMERAAQRAQQNQMNSAQASQQSASRTMQQMLDDIEQTKRAEAQQLLRQLASLIESIDRLITVQENELIALAQAQPTSDYSGRDRAMIRLNQNTMAVENEARAAGQSARRIARSLDRAGDAQGEAVSALRAEPLMHDSAVEAEERSLELLQEAKAMAEELEQQTQEDEVQRQREQIIEKYRELSERQLAVRAETAPLAEQLPLDRRQLVEARRLGGSQEQIRTDLADMQAASAELNDAPVFSHVHRLVSDWSTEASEAMWNGDVTPRVLERQQNVAASIGLLIDALEESIAPPDEFAKDQQQGQQGGGGAGSQQPLIPPTAEIKLVRNLQELIYNQTKAVEDGPSATSDDRRVRLRELGRMQRELIELGTEMLEKFSRENQQQPSPVDIDSETE